MPKSVFGMRIHEHSRGYWVLRRVEYSDGLRTWLLEFHRPRHGHLKYYRYITRRVGSDMLTAWFFGEYQRYAPEIPKIVKRKASMAHRKYLALVIDLNTGKF